MSKKKSKISTFKSQGDMHIRTKAGKLHKFQMFHKLINYSRLTRAKYAIMTIYRTYSSEF